MGLFITLLPLLILTFNLQVIFQGKDIQSLLVCEVRSLLNKKLLPTLPCLSKTLQIAHRQHLYDTLA